MNVNLSKAELFATHLKKRCCTPFLFSHHHNKDDNFKDKIRKYVKTLGKIRFPIKHIVLCCVLLDKVAAKFPKINNIIQYTRNLQRLLEDNQYFSQKN